VEELGDRPYCLRLANEGHDEAPQALRAWQQLIVPVRAGEHHLALVLALIDPRHIVAEDTLDRVTSILDHLGQVIHTRRQMEHLRAGQLHI
jgi:hypothetical protein